MKLKLKISEIDNDPITKAAKASAKTVDECWYFYENHLKPHVFHTGLMYGLVAGVFIGILIVLISTNLV
jgi:hypothetical protein